MKRLVLILILMAAAGLHCRAVDYGSSFEQAREAYNDGRYDECIRLYDGLLSNGVVNIEVHYNLGNACFKSGELPRAVWHYRKAWYAAPRDPDIQANLHFALNAAGAVEPASSVLTRLFTACSGREWVWIGLSAYLSTAAVLLLALLIRGLRPALLKLCLIPLAVLLIAAGGWWYWAQFRAAPEAVILHSGVTARYGPVDGSTAHYKPPLGALVRQYETTPGGWVEIEYDGKRGWINQDDLLAVSP